MGGPTRSFLPLSRSDLAPEPEEAFASRLPSDAGFEAFVEAAGSLPAPLPAPACSPRSLRRQSEPPTVSALRGQFEAERPTVVPSASAQRNLRRHATAGSIPISSSHL